ncbi:MAG: hypothetical protein QQN63_00260 [Nitrosopumilus sp.]
MFTFNPLTKVKTFTKDLEDFSKTQMTLVIKKEKELARLQLRIDTVKAEAAEARALTEVLTAATKGKS